MLNLAEIKGTRAVNAAEGMVAGASEVPASLLRNSQGRFLPKNYTAYVGVKGGEPVYAGVTRQPLPARKAQHGQRFDRLDRVASNLTSRQARGIEQVNIMNNPQFENVKNSIAQARIWYNDAVNWAKRFLKGNASK